MLMKTVPALFLLLVGIYCNETNTLPVAVDSVFYGNIVDVKTADSTSSTTTTKTTTPQTTTTTNMDITDTPETVDGSGTAQEAPDNTENNSDNTQSTPAETNLPEDSFLLAHAYPASNDIDVYDPSNDTIF